MSDEIIMEFNHSGNGRSVDQITICDVKGIYYLNNGVKIETSDNYRFFPYHNFRQLIKGK